MRNKRQEMPKVDIDKLQSLLSSEDFDLVKMFIKSDNSIRASKPKLPKKIKVYTGETKQTSVGLYMDYKYDYASEEDGKIGISAYIWRQVVLFVSPKPAHQCMPAMDICDLPKSITGNGYTMHNESLKRLHDIADVVIDCVQVNDWHGVKRWGMAYGQIGTPQVRENGSIVYR